MMLRPFHLAITVNDLNAARQFYGEIMGCAEGRSDDCWIDFNLFGHQLVVHLDVTKIAPQTHNPVDDHDVPIPHFGIILTMPDWQILAARLQRSEMAFVIKPTTRFKGKAGEQATMFFTDPAGNALEFKAFADDAMIFAVG
jgi:uncharacterized protein